MKKVFFLVAMLACLVGCGKAQNVEYNTQEDNHIEEIIESKNVLYANEHYVSIDTKKRAKNFVHLLPI